MSNWPDRAGRHGPFALILGIAVLIGAASGGQALAQGAVKSSAGVEAKAEAKFAAKYDGIGRVATASEVAAWDIDVRPDFKGLPAGSGSVTKGQDIWEAKCASCHGVFGESNQVFTPLIGGTTAQDVQTGNVASLKDNSFPGRTTLMKLATLSTLWDYINRAMPWNAPKSLSADEVYAVTAFMLNLGGVVPQDFTLSDKNMRDVQARLPNRKGMSTAHGLWPGKELGGRQGADIKAAACSKNCETGDSGPAKVASFVPDYAKNAHGNLADQNRLVGAQHGVATAPPDANSDATLAAGNDVKVDAKAHARSSATAQTGAESKAALALASQHSCIACHGMAQKILGPSFDDIAKKYPDQVNYLAQKIVKGGAGVWGAIPMPAQSISDADARVMAAWLASGATR
jgi:S-disulfanyl-L-cysteine oxidoreductase SoxD